MAPTPVFLPGESQGQRSLVGCHLWGLTELDMTSDLAAAAASDYMYLYRAIEQRDLEQNEVIYSGYLRTLS